MAHSSVPSSATIALNCNDTKFENVCEKTEDEDGGIIDLANIENAASADTCLQRNDDNYNNYSYNKDYEAVLQIKQVSYCFVRNYLSKYKHVVLKTRTIL